MKRSQKSEIRRQNWWLAVCSLALLFSGSMLFARTAVPAARPKGRRFDVVYMAKNQWRMPVSNYGMFGHDAARGSAGGEWPRGSGNMYIFGAGLWFGRRTNNNADTNTTVGYTTPAPGNPEFSPGPGRTRRRVFGPRLRARILIPRTGRQTRTIFRRACAIRRRRR